MNLFPTDKIVFDVPDAVIEYHPNLFSETEANALFHQLLSEIFWQQDSIKLFGKTYNQPRLTAFYGNNGKPYSYSNITMQPHPWTPLLLQIKSKVEEATHHTFSSVLLNLYRNGYDSNGWHADDEIELGQNPFIASVSFGEHRNFQMKHNTIKDLKKTIVLKNGSLLVMGGPMQHHWKHQIPKTSKAINQRINLTFRSLL
jgi:alkylated DNA repair dioxygenase AlkB